MVGPRDSNVPTKTYGGPCMSKKLCALAHLGYIQILKYLFFHISAECMTSQYQEYTSQYLIHIWIVTILSLAPFIKVIHIWLKNEFAIVIICL